MGDLRAEAAQLTGDLTLWATLVGAERGVSGTARLTLLAELVDADSPLAVAAAGRFVDTASDEATPVKIARTIQEPAPEVALLIADGVAPAHTAPVHRPGATGHGAPDRRTCADASVS